MGEKSLCQVWPRRNCWVVRLPKQSSSNHDDQTDSGTLTSRSNDPSTTGGWKHLSVLCLCFQDHDRKQITTKCHPNYHCCPSQISKTGSNTTARGSLWLLSTQGQQRVKCVCLCERVCRLLFKRVLSESKHNLKATLLKTLKGNFLL